MTPDKHVLSLRKSRARAKLAYWQSILSEARAAERRYKKELREIEKLEEETDDGGGHDGTCDAC